MTWTQRKGEEHKCSKMLKFGGAQQRRGGGGDVQSRAVNKARVDR